MTQLLLLALRCAELDADVGDEFCHRRLQAVTTALAHAIVDISDGAVDPSTSTDWPAPMRGTRRSAPPAFDRGECSAAAATAGRMASQLDRLAPQAPLSPRTTSALLSLSRGLQHHAQEGARPHGGPGFGLELSRHLRRAHLLLQPVRQHGRAGSRLDP